ncbi:endonuclease/exonuclease/phosphatase family protein [Rhodococcus sp. IEGM 1381]|uniref:endonuclease/exonuclease/phosphatase family protein n=1 Tax=Rhodococcus sp. IEGM 1381 TaxID=3047085 RepID=UPI0024B6E9D8|nr:endonuclease/exonuclease/phosphatase family protein [Rhodococcus sp. IEGM 1381]MDI9893795.1 endonuclease/exonuclease/phosphatase family protein [Rhodococcus sp. IEGM 1381]
MQRTWVRILTGTIATLGILTGLVAMGVYYTDTRVNVLIALASFVPLMFIAVVLGALVALIGRRWILAGISTLVLAAGAVSYAPLYVADAAPSSNGVRLRVMQANLMVGRADPTAVVGQARENSVDVVTIQELTDASAIGLRDAGMEELFPYSYLRPYVTGGGGAGIYSRLPISDSRELVGYGPVNLATRIEVPDSEPISLLAVHPGPAYITPAEIWTAELDTLRGDLEAVSGTGPVIVSGDFNTTYSHKKFRNLLDAGYSDAAAQLGKGLVPTYPTDKGTPAVVGIDHILSNSGHARSLERIDLPGSDHHGLIGEIEFDR